MSNGWERCQPMVRYMAGGQMMAGVFVTVTCPYCMSSIKLERKAIRTNLFLCPVCLEGEIKFGLKRPKTNRTATKEKTLVTTLTSSWTPFHQWTLDLRQTNIQFQFGNYTAHVHLFISYWLFSYGYWYAWYAAEVKIRDETGLITFCLRRVDSNFLTTLVLPPFKPWCYIIVGDSVGDQRYQLEGSRTCRVLLPPVFPVKGHHYTSEVCI